MLLATDDTPQKGLVVNYDPDIANRDLKLGEIINSKVLRVFANGKILLDLKGTPTIAATTVPLKLGTKFRAKVRKSGRQKWLQIMENNTHSEVYEDLESILREMNLEVTKENLLILQVIIMRKIKPNKGIIQTVPQSVLTLE